MLTSLRNPRVKDVVRLRNRRYRDSERRFVIEGRRELACAIAAGFPVQTVFHCEDFYADKNERQLIERLATAGATCEATSSAVFERLSYRHTPDGVIGVAAMPALDLAALPPAPRANSGDGSLWLVVTAIEKPGNLGAMLRSADAAGATGVLLADPVVDVFNPNVIRASVGTLFNVPLAVANDAAARRWLDERGIRVYVSSPDAAELYTSRDLSGDVALVVGSESAGLDDRWLTIYQGLRIPMAGRGDSLNAATAAALLLFEARRQRGAGVRTPEAPPSGHHHPPV